MKKLALLLTLLLCATPALSDRLTSSDIQYLGSFELPDRYDQGKQHDWNYWVGGLTYAKDCQGFTDPSPNDGYPGCLMGVKNMWDRGVKLPDRREAWVGTFDIVPPGGKATQVVPMYSLYGTYAVDNHPNVFDGENERVYDIVYDIDHPGGCRIWWALHQWFASGMEEGDPYLGYSSCNPSNPDPKGMWPNPIQHDENGFSMFRPNAMGRHLSIMPTDIADSVFGGRRYVLGASKGHGSRGSSTGPSIGVMDFPPDRPKALAYYPHPEGEGFCQWYDDCYWPGATQCQNFDGGDLIRVGNKMAFIAVSQQPEVDMNFYPNNVSNTPYHQGNSNFPPPGIPLAWYGRAKCPNDGTQPHTNWPSYRERDRTGSMMPYDCQVYTECPKGKGPQCRNEKLRLRMWDVEELAEVYAGTRKAWLTLPYESMPLHMSAPCDSISGTTFDDENAILYMSAGKRNPMVHVYQLGSDQPPAGPFCGDGECNGDETWETCSEDMCPQPVDPCDAGCSDDCPQLCPDPCPTQNPELIINQDGTIATIECKVE